jgi:hypothetical protein
VGGVADPAHAPVGLKSAASSTMLCRVSTLTEIEHAIERLPDTEVVRLAAWLAEHRRRRLPSAETHHHDLDFLIGTWQEDPAFDAAVRTFEQVDAEVWK